MDPEPEKIAGLLTRRDDNSPSDWVSILIDSYRDRRTAFEFGVNHRRKMTYKYNDTNNDRGWDAVDAVVSRDAQAGAPSFDPFHSFNAQSRDLLASRSFA
jgi:hypothetical protein